MKKLEPNKMQLIEAGSCDSAIALATAAALTVVVATGPFGWIAVSAAAAAGFANGVNIGVQCFT